VTHSKTVQWTMAAVAGVLLVCEPGNAQQRMGGPPGMGPRGGGPGPQPERAVVAQFDRDGDRRLNAAERAEARAWLATQQPEGGMRGRGGPPGGGPPGMDPNGRRGGPPDGMRMGGPPGGPGGPGGRGGPGGPRAPSAPGIRLAPADVTSYATPLYDAGTLRTLFLQFENNDWEKELAAFYNTDVEVNATATVDGRTYNDVGVAFRGQSSFMMIPEGSKRSLNVTLDFVNEQQHLGGYRTLNLLNANSDPTFIRTVLYSHIARQYLPAPKVNVMRVVINGENWGLYPNAQQFNRDFTKEFFGSADGARWKVAGSPGGRGGMEYLGDDAAAYRRLYEIKSKDEPASWTALINLFRVLNQTPADQLEAALQPILDVDGVLKFLALDVALVNSDGYWTRASDYNIYLDPNGRFHVVPHDMNEALAGNPQLDPFVGLQDTTKPLRSKLLAVPALRARYEGYVRDIAQRWLDWNTIGPIAAQYRALIDADVRRDTRKLYATESFDSGFIALQNFLQQRRAYLLSR
jgi:hypothetical protein